MIKYIKIIFILFLCLSQSQQSLNNDQLFITGFLVGITGEKVPEMYSCIRDVEINGIKISDEIKQIESKNPQIVVTSLRNIFHIAKSFLDRNSDCDLFSHEAKNYVQYIYTKITSENIFKQAILNFLKNSDKIFKNYQKYHALVSNKDNQDLLQAGFLLGNIFNIVLN